MSNNRHKNRARFAVSKTPQPPAAAGSQRTDPRQYGDGDVSVTGVFPFERGAAFNFIDGKSYIPFLGERDDYDSIIMTAQYLSNTQNLCIQTKAEYCAGVGFRDKNGKEFSPEQTAWLSSMNGLNQSARKVNFRAFNGYFSLGNKPIELVRFTVGNRRYFWVYAHNMQEWRLGPKDEVGRITYAIQSVLFSQNTSGMILQKMDTSRWLPLFNPAQSDRSNWRKVTTEFGTTERTLIWVKNDAEGFDHYGIPSHIGSLITQQNENKAGRFDLDNFINNFSLSGMLVLQGSHTAEEATAIKANIIKEHTGDGNRGRLAVVTSEQDIKASDYHSMDTHKEGSFIEADAKYVRKILAANKVPAILLNPESQGSMGRGAGLLTESLRAFNKAVIIPSQRELWDQAWADIFDQCERWTGLPWSKFDLSFENDIDISGLTEIDITPAVKINQVQAALGMDIDPNMEGVYMPGNPKQGAEMAAAMAKTKESNGNNPSKKEEDVPLK